MVWKDSNREQRIKAQYDVNDWELEQKFKDKPNPKIGQYFNRKNKDVEEEQEEVTEEKLSEMSEEELKKELKPLLKEIIIILRKYMDLQEDHYLLIGIWILGTYFHQNFRSYPYLFFNAMKGSGKSRLLSLVTTLSKDGLVLNSLTEAVLFRTKGTLGIDEFEYVARKGNESLIELLNSAYKKTGKVLRMKKTTTKDGESQEVESFDVYRPILMANIYGITETLGDRCIQLVLEKSVKKRVVKLVEDFEDNFQIMEVKKTISKGFGRLGSHLLLREKSKNWNKYVMDSSITPNSSITSNPSNPSLLYNILYNKINKTELGGRDLELFFPLFIMGDLCNKLDEMIEISIKIVRERKEKDVYESFDVQVYDFIAEHTNNSFVRVSDLVQQFRNFCGIEEKQEKWIDSRWFGTSLKRLQLILDKKRSNGMLVILNIEKAKEKILMFREPEIKIEPEKI